MPPRKRRRIFNSSHVSVDKNSAALNVVPAVPMVVGGTVVSIVTDVVPAVSMVVGGTVVPIVAVTIIVVVPPGVAIDIAGAGVAAVDAGDVVPVVSVSRVRLRRVRQLAIAMP